MIRMKASIVLGVVILVLIPALSGFAAATRSSLVGTWTCSDCSAPGRMALDPDGTFHLSVAGGAIRDSGLWDYDPGSRTFYFRGESGDDWMSFLSNSGTAYAMSLGGFVFLIPTRPDVSKSTG